MQYFTSNPNEWNILQSKIVYIIANKYFVKKYPQGGYPPRNGEKEQVNGNDEYRRAAALASSTLSLGPLDERKPQSTGN